jgi:hypothetical protein
MTCVKPGQASFAKMTQHVHRALSHIPGKRDQTLTTSPQLFQFTTNATARINAHHDNTKAKRYLSWLGLLKPCVQVLVKVHRIRMRVRRSRPDLTTPDTPLYLGQVIAPAIQQHHTMRHELNNLIQTPTSSKREEPSIHNRHQASTQSLPTPPKRLNIRSLPQLLIKAVSSHEIRPQALLDPSRRNEQAA